MLSKTGRSKFSGIKVVHLCTSKRLLQVLTCRLHRVSTAVISDTWPMHAPTGHIQLFAIDMIETAAIIIFRREIINVIHHGIRASNAMAARQYRNANAGEYDIEEGSHEIPFFSESQLITNESDRSNRESLTAHRNSWGCAFSLRELSRKVSIFRVASVVTVLTV
jgi:hypothetical protein